MPIFYLIEFRLAKGKKKGTTGVPSRFWGQKFLKTGFGRDAVNATRAASSWDAALNMSGFEAGRALLDPAAHHCAAGGAGGVVALWLGTSVQPKGQAFTLG